MTNKWRKSVNLAQPARFTSSFGHDFDNFSIENWRAWPETTSLFSLPRWKTPKPVCERGHQCELKWEIPCYHCITHFLQSSRYTSIKAHVDKWLCGCKWALLLLDSLTLLVSCTISTIFENLIKKGSIRHAYTALTTVVNKNSNFHWKQMTSVCYVIAQCCTC